MTDQHTDKKPKVEDDTDQKSEIPLDPPAGQQIVPALSAGRALIPRHAVAAPLSNPVVRITYNWHTFYNNPCLDLVLKSSDNVYFRASKHTLKRCSASFSPDRIVTPADPILLPYPSKTIALFLSQLTQPYPPIPIHSSFDVAHQYLEFTKRFAPNHDVLLDCAESAYKATNATYPFEYLIHIATTTGNMLEARWALERMDGNNNEQWDLIEKPAELVEEMERLPTVRRGSIWRLLMRTERDWDTRETTIVLRWPSKRFARRFELYQ